MHLKMSFLFVSLCLIYHAPLPFTLYMTPEFRGTTFLLQPKCKTFRAQNKGFQSSLSSDKSNTLLHVLEISFGLGTRQPVAIEVLVDVKQSIDFVLIFFVTHLS